MTADPLTAVLDQLAAHREQLTQLDDREAAHFAAVGEQLTQLAGLITTMGRTLADDTAALARLEALDRQVTDLADRLAGPGADGKDRSPARPGASLVDAHPRRTQASRSPGCGPGSTRCTGPATATWPPPSAPAGQPHDLCLYGLDILSQLWRALYLQPARSTSLLSAQAEYQARILPALAAQLMTETTGCDHNPARGYTRSSPMTNPALRQALALRRARLARLPLPARPEDPGHPARLPRRHHRPAADHRMVRPAGRLEPGHRHRRPRTRRPRRRPARPRRQRVQRLRPAPRRRAARGRQRLRPHPQRRPARLLHRLGPAQRPPARAASGLPVRRRLRPGPAIPGPRQALSAHQDPRRPRRPGLAGRHPAAGTRPPVPAASHPPAARLRDHPPGPLGRRPARRQPQRRPVLGRQPRTGRRPGRRPQRAGRRRPPGRPPRTRDHPHPELRPPHPPRRPQRPRPPGRRSQLT